jgi:8-oxo-dGTP diphosphatase
MHNIVKLHDVIDTGTLEVAVGVVTNKSGQVLISYRNEYQHQGGLWEFPGGKIETGETAEQALTRELQEELGITVHSAHPLISINHAYPERSVRLIVYAVTSYSGAAVGREGQQIKWVEHDKLSQFKFPEANQPIIQAARLPPYYAILDDADETDLIKKLNALLKQNIKLIQARFKRLPQMAAHTFLEQAYPLCRQQKAILMLNSTCDATGIITDGTHLTSRHLLALDKRPEGIEWLAASCHNLEELLHAQSIGADFAVLAPVLPTPTHPDAKVLGWDRFAELVSQVNIPVYALGGLCKADLSRTQCLGGQGIAAIRAFLG